MLIVSREKKKKSVGILTIIWRKFGSGQAKVWQQFNGSLSKIWLWPLLSL